MTVLADLRDLLEKAKQNPQFDWDLAVELRIAADDLLAVAEKAEAFKAAYYGDRPSVEETAMNDPGYGSCPVAAGERRMRLARDILLAPVWFVLAGVAWLVSKVPESWTR